VRTRTKFKIILLLCLFYVGRVYAEDREILEIRKYYKSVESNLKNLTQSKIDYIHKTSHVDETDLLSETIYFYKDKNQIVKIVGDKVFDCSGSVNELTYKNKDLLFIYTYDWMGCNREAVAKESRYYFKNKKLIRWLEGKEKIDNSKFPAKEKELLKLSNFYYLKSPN